MVYLKTVCKKTQPNRLYVCSRAAAASLKVLSSLENLNLPSPLNACTNAPSTSSNWVQHCWRCTQPASSPPGCSVLLPETHFCQSPGPGSKAPWHGNRGEGMRWKGKEKRKWRHRFRCTSGNWKGRGNYDLDFRLGVRAENEKCGVGMSWQRN